MFDRCLNIVTEQTDREQDTAHIESVLVTCGYPKWTFTKVMDQIKYKAEKTDTKTKQKEKKKEENIQGMVVLPHVKGITEQLKRVFSKYRIATSVKPHLTLRNILVYPKDKIDTLDKTGVVYKITCNNCKKIYIGEPGRKLGVRSKEHRQEVDELPDMSQTRSQ